MTQTDTDIHRLISLIELVAEGGRNNKMKLPAASGWGIRRYIPFVTPHPNPLPKEREPYGNPAASSGVLKTPNK